MITPYIFTPCICKDNQPLEKQAIYFVRYVGNNNSKAVSQISSIQCSLPGLPRPKISEFLLGIQT